jgi:hypothetical protein
VIRQLADRLEIHRLRYGSPVAGPIFANSLGKPLALSSAVNRIIVPVLNRCEACGKGESDHRADHPYKRDARFPEWHGWHAARRGLGSNLYRLGVPDVVIQRILRHANVSTTATYYIKTAAVDVRNAMTKLGNHIAEADRIQSDTNGALDSKSNVEPSTSRSLSGWDCTNWRRGRDSVPLSILITRNLLIRHSHIHHASRPSLI